MAAQDPNEMSGLARSIGSLFDGDGGLTRLPVTGPGEKDDPAVGEDAPNTDAEGLREAVRQLLGAESTDRPGLRHTVEAAALPLQEAGAVEPLIGAVERLLAGAGDPPEATVLDVARHLLSPAVTNGLAAHLGSERDEGRRSELSARCALLGADMLPALADALSGTTDRFARHTYVDVMAAMGDSAMPVIEEMVEDSRWFVVRNAVSILGESGGERAVELIVSTLAHTDGRVRRQALLALGKVGGDDAGMLVYGMLEDPDPEVRLAAAMAAGSLKVERALKPLLSLLDEENDHDVVVGVLGALGKLGDPGAVPSIEKKASGSFLSRPPSDVRIAAYRALHAIGTPHAKSLLVRAADDKNTEVKGAVRHLLRMR